MGQEQQRGVEPRFEFKLFHFEHRDFGEKLRKLIKLNPPPPQQI